MKKIIAAFIGGALLSAPLLAAALTAEDIYKRVNKSVYTIYTVNFYNKSPESLGSAIAVTDHILATNCHVALTGNYLGVVVHNEFKLGTLFFRDINRDICFVEIPGMTFSPVKIRDSKDVNVGEQVFAVGNPEGLEKSISQGIVSNKRQDRGGYVLQTDAAVSFGSSGGGLFDASGQLIGITNSIDRHSKNIAFALPTEWISQILFPKVSVNAGLNKQIPGKLSATHKVNPAAPSVTLQKLGNFGKDNVSLFRYGHKCFVIFTGKNEYGETAGSALWYPEKPEILMVFPNSVDVSKNLDIMDKVFYESQGNDPSYSKNYLFFGSQKNELVGVKDANNRFSILVTKLQPGAGATFPSLAKFAVKFEDGVTVQGFKEEAFGLDGFKDTMKAYKEQCHRNSPAQDGS